MSIQTDYIRGQIRFGEPDRSQSPDSDLQRDTSAATVLECYYNGQPRGGEGIGEILW